jgi:hypothetical protein
MLSTANIQKYQSKIKLSTYNLFKKTKDKKKQICR